jgi:ribonuclease HI
MIEIYTDGSCIGNPGPGGWGLIMLYKGEQIELSGGEEDTTNNRMEMTAIIKALELLHKKFDEKEFNNLDIKIYSDSNLIIQTLNQGWKKKANTDLWAEIDKHRAWLNITWTWVKAHHTNKYNNLVDVLAFNEAQKIKKSL